MRTPWHDVWGSGRGPAARLAPQSRILTGGSLLGACLIAPAGTAPGLGLIAALTAGWMAFCGMPARAVRSFAVLGLGVFLPFFLLAPFLVPRAAPGAAGWAAWTRALVGPWDVVLHGLAGMFVGAATVTSLSASDFRRGLLALPLPHSVAAVLIQIVHQTGVLLSETSRVSAAVAVRAGAGAGPAAWRALFSLPRVWLPRIMTRAERVAAAMDMRGYAEADLRILGGTTLGWPDWGALAGACLALALAAALRWGGMP